MEIRIEEVLDATRGWVRFRSGAELVTGCWVGSGEVPVGRALHVEVEVSEEAVLSVRPAVGPPWVPVAQDGDVVVIVGRVERVEDDGVIDFRVGDDVVLLDGTDLPTEVVEGAHVELRVPEVRLYPYEL